MCQTDTALPHIWPEGYPVICPCMAINTISSSLLLRHNGLIEMVVQLAFRQYIDHAEAGGLCTPLFLHVSEVSRPLVSDHAQRQIPNVRR